MAREGMKEHDARRKKEEDDLSSLKLKRMLTSNIRVLEPRVYNDEYMPTNRSRKTNEVICERPTTPEPVVRQPILSDNFSDVNDGGRDMTIFDGGVLRKLKVSHGGGRVDGVNVVSYLCERTQDSELKSKSTTSNNTSSGISMILETTDLAPGRTAVDTAGGEMKVKVT